MLAIPPRPGALRCKNVQNWRFVKRAGQQKAQKKTMKRKNLIFSGTVIFLVPVLAFIYYIVTIDARIAISAHNSVVWADLRNIRSDLERYYSKHNHFPESITELSYKSSKDVLLDCTLEAQGYICTAANRFGNVQLLTTHSSPVIYGKKYKAGNIIRSPARWTPLESANDWPIRGSIGWEQQPTRAQTMTGQ
jgi:hypothetical protein